MSILNLQVSYEGKTPIAAGDKRLTVLNVAQLLNALNHGSRYKQGASYVQYQTGVVQASGTVTAAAVQSGDTVSIGGQALTAAQKRATGTATASSVLADTTLTINGQVFTAVDGAVALGAATFDCSGNDAACATSIAAQVNAYGGAKISGVVGAKSASAVVTIYAMEQGTGGNAIALASSDGATLAVSAANLANGAAIENNKFDFAGSNTTTAAAIAAAINASTTAAVKQATATSAAAVVTVTAKVGGVGGNAIAWVSSDGTRLAVSGSGTLTNGAADAAVRLNF